MYDLTTKAVFIIDEDGVEVKCHTVGKEIHEITDIPGFVEIISLKTISFDTFLVAKVLKPFGITEHQFNELLEVFLEGNKEFCYKPYL